MTLQQLRYLIAIAEAGSISAAAYNIYASQSNLSIAMKELEHEFDITIFTRSNRGVTLTNEGTELLAYARQVVEQADMLENRFAGNESGTRRLAISTQHYAFCVRAFINTVERCEDEDYDFVLREAPTNEIIEDVRDFRSDIGILFTDKNNERVLGQAFKDASLKFHPLFIAPVHVFVGEEHPLADRELIEPEDLAEYPRYSFEQGTINSFLLLGRTAAPHPAQAQHPLFGPRDADEPSHRLRGLHAFDGRAHTRDAVGHRLNPASHRRQDDRRVPDAQGAHRKRASGRLHRAAQARHQEQREQRHLRGRLAPDK